MLRTLILTRNFSTRCCQVLCQQAKPKEQKPKDKNVFYHEEFKINYKRLYSNDKTLSQLMLLVKSKKKLNKEQQIIVEGSQLIKEAVQSHFKLNHLLFTQIDKVADLVNVMGQSSSGVNFVKVPQQDLTYWSVLTTCPGLIGIFDKPNNVRDKSDALPITVICDNIREPNNVGAVIRLANSLPATRVLLPKGCADQWETKAIRGSSGSVFFIPTEDGISWQEIDDTVETGEDSVVLIADNDATKYNQSVITSYDQIPIKIIKNKQIYLIVGGETHGIGDEAKNFAFKRKCNVVNIPLDYTVNSLNTSNALAIILFELRRKLSGLQ